MSRYFNELIDIVDGRGYENLLLHMFNTPFYCKVHNDSNTLHHCRDLRNECNAHHDDDYNVFEFFIALARGMDDILHDLQHGDRTADWFWMMMENMGLTQYTNPNYDEKRVDVVIQNFIERRFAKNGEGGPFPLKRPLGNMRRTEWWYALNWYVEENYDYEFNDIQEEFEDE